MKIKPLHVAAIAAVALLVHRQVKAQAAVASNGQVTPVQSAGAWWTYAGMWGQSA
jgi:hypothetical protein